VLIGRGFATWAASIVAAASAGPRQAPSSGAALRASLVGRPAPALSLRDLEGRPLDLTRYRGKVVLLDFWATWCVPCREEIPQFVKLQKKYGARGLAVIGISMDDERAPVAAFYRQHAMNYPVAMGTAAVAERYGGILGLPVAFVIDRSGRVDKRYDGQVELSQLERELVSLLER
jgi:cytochrome c biogenesis protein CcmG/thiol:disulfide interchange protein DsbE